MSAFDHEHKLRLLITRAWFNYTVWKKQWNGKNKERVCSFLILPYTVTKYAYKETAHIVLILIQDEIIEREKFTVPYYSITLVLGAKSLSTAPVDMSYLSCFFFISGL